MKKLIFLTILMFIVSIALSQKPKVVSAYNYLRNNQLEKAQEAIDEAIYHESTAQDPKTWFYRGNVYLAMAIELNKNSKDASKFPKASLDTAYYSYLKSEKYDEKGRWEKDRQKGMQSVATEMFNRAVANYNNKAFDKAIEDFTKAKKLMADNEKVVENADRNIILSYILWSEKTRDNGDTAQALSIIENALIDFPENYNLIIAKSNVLLIMGENQKAENALKTAIEKDPENPILYYNIATTYEGILNDTASSEAAKENALQEAKSAYLKAIEIKPDYFDAYYNLGALYNNRAADILTTAGNLEFGDPKYDELKTKADTMLQNAIPYLEKAMDINPEDIYTLNTLMQLYAKTNQIEKFRSIKAKIEKLKTKPE